MEWGEFMAAPKRKPVCPTQKQFPSGLHDFPHIAEKIIGLGKMLVNVGADHHVILSQPGKIIPVNVEWDKSRAGGHGLQIRGFVGESNLASPFDQHSAENPVSATQIEHARLRRKGDGPALQQLDRILGLKQVKMGSIFITVPQMVQNQPVNDHAA
jgi:hypothetical protein